MLKYLYTAITTVLIASSIMANPFSVNANISLTNVNDLVLDVAFKIPYKHYLYEDAVKVKLPKNLKIKKIAQGQAQEKLDPISGQMQNVYAHDFVISYLISAFTNFPLDIVVDFLGCNDSICFLPESLPFSLALTSQATNIKSDLKTTSPLNEFSALTNDFTIIGSAAGYLNTENFIKFIDDSESGKIASKQSVIDAFKNKGLIISIILIIIGGFLLNLTPCVLPMIPINLAIIGAGVQAKSRKRGFVLGGIFGLGIAMAYGTLGVLVALTGAQFGTINASPIFNLIITVVFVVLALAMFDIISIDLTRFQRNLSHRWTNKGTSLAAFILGILTALMAGACVAPVVIQVLIISADFYAKGNLLGLALPFLLGVGMALPWPFAGASLSLLPKPGKWMTKVKYLFGFIILIFAFHYAVLAIKTANFVKPKIDKIENGMDFKYNIPDAIAAAQKENKYIIIDFWASWCKNCHAMDRTTFRDESVKKRLDNYVFLKYQAEKPSAPDTKPILDMFDVKGLPTYIILKPKQ